jgi:hypothetical protein
MKWRFGLSVLAAVTMFSGVSMGIGSAAMISLNGLKSEALSITQMPSGWTTHHPTYDVRMGCLTNLLEPKGVKETHFVEVYFLGRGDLPVLVETLTTYSNAQVAYQRITKNIASCKKVAGNLKGYAVTGTVRPMASPHYGNASVVYLLTISGTHLTFKADYAIVRKGNVVVAVLEGTYPSVNTLQFRKFVAAAVAKVKK